MRVKKLEVSEVFAPRKISVGVNFYMESSVYAYAYVDACVDTSLHFFVLSQLMHILGLLVKTSQLPL